MQRSDPMYYEFDIRENKTQEVHRARLFCWWTGEHSIAERKRMCDCQLGALFSTGLENFQSWDDYVRYGPRSNGFASQQHEYLKRHPCNHKPSRKYSITSIYLPSGETFDLTEKAAA